MLSDNEVAIQVDEFVSILLLNGSPSASCEYLRIVIVNNFFSGKDSRILRLCVEKPMKNFHKEVLTEN